jgi:hypothetical protein
MIAWLVLAVLAYRLFLSILGDAFWVYGYYVSAR